MRARSWRAVVTTKRDQPAALKLLKRTIVTDGLRAYSAAMKEIGSADRHKVGAASTIGQRTRISRFGDESERCSAFEA